MKLVQTKRDDLLKPLQAVSGIVEKRHTLPILSNVLFERSGDALLFLATDLEIQVSTSFNSRHALVSKRGKECWLPHLLEQVRQSACRELDKLAFCEMYMDFFVIQIPSGECFVIGQEHQQFGTVESAKSYIQTKLYRKGGSEWKI